MRWKHQERQEFGAQLCLRNENELQLCLKQWAKEREKETDLVGHSSLLMEEELKWKGSLRSVEEWEKDHPGLAPHSDCQCFRKQWKD